MDFVFQNTFCLEFSIDFAPSRPSCIHPLIFFQKPSRGRWNVAHQPKRRTRSVGLRHSPWLHVTKCQTWTLNTNQKCWTIDWYFLFQNGSASTCDGIRGHGGFRSLRGRDLQVRQNGRSQNCETSVMAENQARSHGDGASDIQHAQGSRKQIFLSIHSGFHFTTLVGHLLRYHQEP